MRCKSVSGCIGFVVAFASYAESAIGQDIAAASHFDNEKQIVVTAERETDILAESTEVGILGERDLIEAPFSVSAYDDETIADIQARSINDILALDSAARSTWSPSAGYAYAEYTVRGLLVNSSDVTLNNLYGLSPTGAMPPEAIENFQILKGPSALLGGVSLHRSVGGSMNIATKRAETTAVTAVGTTFDTDALLGGYVDVGRRFGRDDSLGVRVNALARSGDTAIDRQNLEVLFGIVGADYRSGSFRLSGDILYNRQERSVPNWPLRVTPGLEIPEAPPNATNFQQPWAFLETEDILGFVEAEVDLAPNWSAYGRVGHKDTAIDTLVSFATLTSEAGDIDQSFAYIPRDFTSTSGEIGLRGQFETGPVSHDLVIAVSALRQRNRIFNSFARGAPSNVFSPIDAELPETIDLNGQTRSRAENQRRSISVADTISIWDERFQLLVGGRLQQVRTLSFEADGNAQTDYDKTVFTPGIGFVARPVPSLSLYANRIEGFVQPVAPVEALNFAETFAPLRTEQIEVGAKYQHGSTFLSVSLFEITQPRPVIEPGTFLYSISGEERTRGIETTVQFAARSWVNLLGGVTFLDADQVETGNAEFNGNRAVGVPDLQLNGTLEIFPPPIPGLVGTIQVLHTGNQFVDQANTQSIPSWTTVNLGLRYAFALGTNEVVFRANLENVFDEAYWASAVRDLTVGAPRTLRLGISIAL